MEIKDKVAIVTGASSGIGFACAKLLSQNGAKVALASRSKDKLEEISKSLSGSFVVVADMSAQSDIKRMVGDVYRHYGRIDILVNNAGQGYDSPAEKIDIATYRKVFELDVVGPLVAMQQAIPIMRKQGGGAIVNISSGTALMHLPNMSGYSSLKRALAGISLTAREELKKDNISVSVVYPYITLTDFEKNTIRAGGTEESEGESPAAREAPGNADAGGRSRPPPDTAEFIAQKILEGIKSSEAEIYAHEWMKNLGKK